jgi:hypothetical protein
MKNVLKIMVAGVLCIAGPAVCSAQMTVNVSTSYTIPSAVAAQGASSYQWLENGVVISGATATAYTNTAGKSTPGQYDYVCQAYISSRGWVSSKVFTVTVALLPPRYARSAKITNYADRQWSDVIRYPPCNKTTYAASADTADCRSYKGHYHYSWNFVSKNANTLCPSPWRVPTIWDYSLMIGKYRWMSAQRLKEWGDEFVGHCLPDGDIMSFDLGSAYVTSTEQEGSPKTYFLVTNRDGNQKLKATSYGYGGLPRCVQDAPAKPVR